MKELKDRNSEHLSAQERMALLSSYYSWSLSFLGPLIGKKIWDAGAGIGIVAEKLAKQANYVLATDIGEGNLKKLNERFKDNPKVEIRMCDLTQAYSKDVPKEIDTIIHLDVLEHIQDDKKVLRLFYECLPINGHLLVKVPAHPSLYCLIDKASSHRRRYTRKELRSKLIEAGFCVHTITYMNMLGAVLYFIKGKILRNEGEFANAISQGRFGLMNQIIPTLREIEKVIPACFGLSVIAVAVKR